MGKQNIVLVTPARFASVNLAEYLDAAGRLAVLYTGYPRFKLRDLRIDPARVRSFPWLQTPHMALGRWPSCPRGLLRELGWQAQDWVDIYAARTLPACDLVSAMSGTGLRTGTEIKRRGGAYVCERGSTHIVFQQRILGEEYAALGMSWDGALSRTIDKELAEYALADIIAVGSSFSLRSFVEMGVPASKLRLTPYGVSLSIFRRSAARSDKFRVLFAGQPTVRKGLHYLLQAFRRARLPGAELVLVGGTAPDLGVLKARFPIDGVTMLGFLSRERLIEEMSRASVVVVPSIEEGLAAVQAQALACGTPVIATPNAGAEDLFDDGKEGFIVPARDVDAIVERLTRLHRDRTLVDEMGRAGVRRVEALGGWDTYGRKMLAIFDELIVGRSRAAARAGVA